MNRFLKRQFDDLNEQFFKNEIIISDIRWMKHKSKKVFGRYHIHEKIIEINRVLMSNKISLRFVLYHEMIHALLDVKGRIKHNSRFYALLKKYPSYEAVNESYMRFVKDYWIKIGYTTKKELEGCD